MAHRVEARIEVEPDLPMPDIDPNQIQQVFVNLHQQRRAGDRVAPAGPARIVVRARRWLDGVAIDVIDDGPGMSEALAAQVFEPFFTTKPEGEGTGLGLSISQGIVSEHGGRIMLATEEGRGSTFTVQLPLATRPPRAAAGRRRAARRHEAPPRARGRRRAAHPALHARDAGGVGPRPRRGARRRGRRWRSPRASRSISSSRTSGCRELGGREFYEELERRAPGAGRRGSSSAPATRCAATRWPSSRASTAPTSTSRSASPSFARLLATVAREA